MTSATLSTTLWSVVLQWSGLDDLNVAGCASKSLQGLCANDLLWIRFLPMLPARMTSRSPPGLARALVRSSRFRGWFESLEIQTRDHPSRLSLRYVMSKRYGVELCHLCVDDEPIYCLGANDCNSLSTWFEQVAATVEIPLVDKLSEALNGHASILTADLELAIHELLPSGLYGVCNFSCIPGEANCRDSNCMFDMSSDDEEDDGTLDEYVPVHRPDMKYYTSWPKQTSLPWEATRLDANATTHFPQWWQQRWPLTRCNMEKRNFKKACQDEPSFIERFDRFEQPSTQLNVIFLTTQSVEQLDEGRVCHYMGLLQSGLQPTVLCFSTLDARDEHVLYRNPHAQYWANHFFINWIIDGHHKIEAARRLGRPVRILSYCLHGDSRMFAAVSASPGPRPWHLYSEPSVEMMTAITCSLCSCSWQPKPLTHTDALSRLGKPPFWGLLRNLWVEQGATYSDFANFLLTYFGSKRYSGTVSIDSLDGISFTEALCCTQAAKGAWIVLCIPDARSAREIFHKNECTTLCSCGPEYPSIFQGKRYTICTVPVKANPTSPQH